MDTIGEFIETENQEPLKLDKHIDLIVKLPTEENAMLLGAKVVNIQPMPFL